MKKLMLIAVLGMIALQGCSWSVSGGVGAEMYYPDVRTKEGGGFGDPDRSRHEVTRSTTSHVRNNDGGNDVDAALRRFFKTK